LALTARVVKLKADSGMFSCPLLLSQFAAKVNKQHARRSGLHSGRALCDIYRPHENYQSGGHTVLPQSRKRPVGKRKGRKGLYAQQPQHAGGRTKRSTRIIAIVLIGALAIAGLAYLFLRGGDHTVTTASGLRYEDLVVGTGETAATGKKVSVHYTGTLESGKKFDSSYDHPGQKPLEYTLGSTQIIQGWNEGISGMKVGGKRKLIIPARLGYGAQGKPPDIPGNATLVFEIELVDVK
jgi:FKBP-type peptidyl-prolyl cis-trans isomerase